jgi:Fe-S-cluster-containing dehydrogenase component/CRP-like cAMP-binding protein
MPRQETKHSEILEAIRRTDSIAELVEKAGDHFKHELELEVIVYGRNYAGKKVGPYVRLLTYEAGEQIIQQGDIGTNTFYVLVEGTLDVMCAMKMLRATASQIGLKIAELTPDTSFGEMAILAGVPRNATVCVPAGGEARVLEFTRPALRLLRKLKRFGERLDRTYRDHGLGRTLEDLRQVGGDLLDSELLADLRGIARFAIYGKNHVLTLEGARIQHVLLIKNGWLRRVSGEMSSLSLTNAALNADAASGVDFLGAGNCLGLQAANATSITDAEQNQIPRWRSTAVVLARTEVIEIPLDALRANTRLRERLVRAFDKFSIADDDVHVKTSNRQKIALVAAEKEITTGVVDGTNLLVMDMDLCIRCGNCSLACHKVHGQSRLLRRGIHIERPRRISPDIRSDAKPKFPFGNITFPISSSTQHVLSPAVCMHCQDPECLTGCPTGAIGWNASGEIDINASTCIGCGDCATQCPYDAISMVARGGGNGAKPKRGNVPPSAPPSRFVKVANKIGAIMNLSPAPLPAAVTETEDLLAVKCNLCHDTTMNPKGRQREAYSCQENCPTGALVRVNPRAYFTEVGRTLGVVFRIRRTPSGATYTDATPPRRCGTPPDRSSQSRSRCSPFSVCCATDSTRRLSRRVACRRG